MRSNLLSAFFALAVVVSQRAYALPDELEVHLDDVTKQGTFAVDIITNYTVSGPRRTSDDGLRPTRHLIQVSPDFSSDDTDQTARRRRRWTDPRRTFRNWPSAGDALDKQSRRGNQATHWIPHRTLGFCRKS